eukprot:COSAG02_NODE_60744_length_270_cov_0.900585_1_plen_25_part_10
MQRNVHTERACVVRTYRTMVLAKLG